jgi:hypothetical protein
VYTRKPLDLILVEGEEPVGCDGCGWFTAEASGLLTEFDEREKAFSLGAHVLSVWRAEGDKNDAPHILLGASAFTEFGVDRPVLLATESL